MSFRSGAATGALGLADCVVGQQIVIELADKVDEDRTADVGMAADHRGVGADDPEWVIGIECALLPALFPMR